MELFLRMVVTVLFLTSSMTPTDGRKTSKRHTQGSSGQPEVCQQPAASGLERQLSSPMDLHGSFYQFPPLLNSVTTLEKFMKSHRQMVTIRRSYLSFDRKNCENSEYSNSGPGGSRDPCPLVWKFNHDNHRVPPTMVEAECLSCTICQKLNPEDFTMGCGPVRYYTKVLRRTGQCDQDGFYQYVEVWEPLTMGCACRSGVNTRPDKGEITRVH